MSAPDQSKKINPDLRRAIEQKRADISADNEAKREERNARRWREERDPVEYERQKAQQRADYAAQVASEDGREVRAYAKVPGKTRAEHNENAKLRRAEKERNRWANASQADKDQKADKVWEARMRKKGWSDLLIASGLSKRQNDRYLRKFDTGDDDNPNYGVF